MVEVLGATTNGSSVVQAPRDPDPRLHAGQLPGPGPDRAVPGCVGLVRPRDHLRTIAADPRIATPNRKDAGPTEYNSLHPGGCNFLFCDGSVRFLKDKMNPRTFSNLATPAGGEAVSDDRF